MLLLIEMEGRRPAAGDTAITRKMMTISMMVVFEAIKYANYELFLPVSVLIFSWVKV